MDLEAVVRKFFLWHVSYLDDPEQHCPSMVWIQAVIQELLERMLPYAAVTTQEKIININQVRQEEHYLQNEVELLQVFNSTRSIVFQLLFQLAAYIHQNVLGYPTEEGKEEEECARAVALLNSEELEHYGAHCTIIFHSCQHIEVSVSRAHEYSHMAAAFTRHIGEAFASFQRKAVCQYRVSKDNECRGDVRIPFSEARQFSDMYAIVLETQCDTIYFTAVRWCTETQKFLVCLSWDKPFPQEPREGEHYKEENWLNYCRLLCNQTLTAAYLALLNRNDIEEDIQAASAVDISEPLTGGKREREQDEVMDHDSDKRQKH